MLATSRAAGSGNRSVLIAFALVLVLAMACIQPGAAETAGQRSTRNIILAATAVTVGIILYNHYEHNVAQNTVVGRTRDGGVVYGDGRILYPGGIIVYASNDGIHPCAYYGAGGRCGPHALGHPWHYEGDDQWHGEGLHKGWYKGKGNPHHDDADEDHDHQ